MTAAPRALILLRSAGWMGIARLPRALVQAGIEVASLCPQPSFLGLTRFNQHRYAWPDSGNPLHALDAAVCDFRPDWLVPGCDDTVRLLQDVVRAGADGRWPAQAQALLALVQRSLGLVLPTHNRLSKHDNLALARRLGYLTPRQHLVADGVAVESAAAELGWPVVLKLEFGSAGGAVRICDGPAALAAACMALRPAPHTGRLAVQGHVSGSIAMCAGVAVQGRLLEHVSALKLHTHPSITSPCSVLRFVDHPGMAEALAAWCAATGFSGFCAADFILTPDGRACVLEFNPRPTPLSALGALRGRDLGAAFCAHLGGRPYTRPAPLTAHDTVALFPNETARDPHSPYLRQAFHDVPCDDPALLQALRHSLGARQPRADSPPQGDGFDR